MGKSGFATLLLLLIAALIVLLALRRTTGGLSGLSGDAAERTPEAFEEVPIPPILSTPGGLHQVDQMRRELQAMDSLAQSVYPAR